MLDCVPSPAPSPYGTYYPPAAPRTNLVTCKHHYYQHYPLYMSVQAPTRRAKRSSRRASPRSHLAYCHDRGIRARRKGGAESTAPSRCQHDQGIQGTVSPCTHHELANRRPRKYTSTRTHPSSGVIASGACLHGKHQLYGGHR